MTGQRPSQTTRLGPRLRQQREAANVSLRDLAAALGVPPQRLSEYERGQAQRQDMPPELWERAQTELAALVSRRASEAAPDLHPLTALRLAHGWSLSQLARRVADIDQCAPDRHKVWRWENWGVIPDHPSQLALAELMGIPASAVMASSWPAWLPGTDGADVHSPWNLSGLLAALDATGEAAMDRRRFLTLTTAAVASLGDHWLGAAAILPGLLPQEAAAGSANDVVATFEARLPFIREQENLHGGGSVLGSISAELATARQMLDWPLGQVARHRLLGVTAELGRLGGWAAFDAGRPAAAETYFIAALRAAREARDPTAAANTIKSVSLLLIESGRPGDARHLLSAGQRAAAQGPLRVRAMVASRQARAEAVMGNSKASRARLGEAADLLERALGRDDHPPQTSYFGPGELAAQSAVSHQILGRHATTVGLLEETLAGQPDDRPRDRGTYQLWLCRSALAMGDLDRAQAVLSDQASGLSAATITASFRNQRLLHGVRGQLAGYRGNAAADQVDERLRDLVP